MNKKKGTERVHETQTLGHGKKDLMNRSLTKANRNQKQFPSYT
jgi:hypothetical protein